MMDPHSPPKALFKDSQLSSYLELVSRNAESEVAAIPREQLADIGIEEVAETLLAKIAPRAPLLRLDKRYAYYWDSAEDVIYLVYLYAKNELANLNPNQLKLLKRTIEEDLK